MTTGSIGQTAQGQLAQPMPNAISPVEDRDEPYVPPTDIGMAPASMNASAGTAVGMTTGATASSSPLPTVQTQALPPLPSPENKPAMSAQSNANPVQVASGGAPAPVVAASQPAPQLSAVPDNAMVHVIKSGESLYSISREFDVSTQSLVAANKLTSADRIFVGQKLIIPGRTADMTVKQPVVTASAAPETVVPAPRADRTTTASVAQTHTTVSTPAPKAETPAAKPVQTATANIAAQPTPQTGSEGEFRWPVAGSVITTFSASRSGINIAAKEGTTVRAADAGTVLYVGSAVEGFGNLILIRHDNGYVSAYAHLKDANVKKGEHVMRGQAIGTVGMTGSVNRPQLHFELREGATPVDPMPLLAG